MMDNQPIDDRSVLEALEACRPGSDDLSSPTLEFLRLQLAANPKLRDLYARLQKIDAAVGEQMRDVPVPEGLQQRLLQALSVARDNQSVGPECPASVGSSEPAGAVPQVAVASPRRRWLASAVAGLATAGVAAAVLVAVWIVQNRHRYTPDVVVDQAQMFFVEETGHAAGRLLEDPATPAPAEFPFSRYIVQAPGLRWRAVEGFLGRSGIAFDMPDGRATLYVVDRQVAGLRAGPTDQADSATAGYHVSAWQENALLYVLVVRGERRDYQDYLRLPGGSLT